MLKILTSEKYLHKNVWKPMYRQESSVNQAFLGSLKTVAWFLPVTQ